VREREPSPYGSLRSQGRLVETSRLRTTRNPLYVGVSAALCGIALIFALDWLPMLVAGALTVLLGMVLFAVIVFRTSGQERAMPVGAEQRAGVFHFENKA
jgi:hypothetical protein